MHVTKYIKILLFFSLLWASPAHLTGGAGNSFNLDIDNDGTTQALTDGLLVLRYLFGFQGSSLIENAVSASATRFTATDIKDYLDTNNSLLDVDGNGQTDSLTDGLLLLRYLFGFSGQSLIEASLAVDAERATSGEIESYVYAYLDSDGDGVTNANDAFPLNPQETVDSDGDGVGNNADSFPTNPGESVDTDGDGIGDNGDGFPLNELEWMDADGDGVGDNADAFPANVREWEDSDADGIGDNSDLFPNNAYESADYDADGVGDNSDAFPFDASEVRDTDADGIGNNADLDDDGDGVADELDIASDNASISKALAVNLDQVASIGLGNGLETPADPQGVGVGSLTKQWVTGLSELFEFDKNRHLFGQG
ncbi:MAG: thrombospondin type 3 repeat-containing protein [Gammaproteobacteria bacterium]|nr:thrombospondin type 3 repeat-containing protein [Gammaproteobacteria bacterium]